MRTGLLVFALTLASALDADEFGVSKDGVGPFIVSTAITYEGKGERLRASAMNGSGETILHAKFCVVTEKGCLFTFWTTAEWKPGEKVEWSVASDKHISNLSHHIKVLSVESASKKAASSRKNPSLAKVLAAVAAASVAPPSGGNANTAPPLGLPGISGQPELGGTQKLMLFGGRDHKTYLGCLNCSKFDRDSIFNEFGPHGSAFETDSIFNRFGDFGSSFSDYSPCNRFASDPPVIVDPQGNFYGRLTINALQPERTRSEYWTAWIAGVCQRP